MTHITTHNMMIAGILLAAGRSQRMGQPKQLLPWHGVPLVRHTAESALQSTLNLLIVVTGYRMEHVHAALENLPVRIIQNEQFLDGQSTSIRAGLMALPAEAEAAMILLVDQPLLRAGTIDQLLDTWNAETLIVAPRYRGRRGNPVLFARSLFPELVAITGDKGARDVIARYESSITYVDVDDEGVVLDLDTPDMYAQMIERSTFKTR